MSNRTLRWTLLPTILLIVSCGGGGGGSGGGETKPLPSIRITTPSNGMTVTGSRSITVTGEGANLDSVQVKLNGVALPAADVSATATGFSAKLTLGDNANTIEAVASNANGTASSGVVTVTFPFVRLAIFQPADVVIGQADFVHSGAWSTEVSAAKLRGPLGNPLVHGGKLYVGEYVNNRVTVFDPVPTANGASASLVLGQPDFTTSSQGTTERKWGYSSSVAADASGKLLVGDYSNSRVLILNSAPTASSPAADLVVGQADLLSSDEACTRTGLHSPNSVFTVGGKLLVADQGNHRVLVWNSIPTSNGTPADLVLGQADFRQCQRNAGGATITAGGFDNPTDVWSDGTRLVVTDHANNRVLIWNTFPTVNGAAADLAVGQADLLSSRYGNGQGALFYPYFASSNGNQLAVSDNLNHRVMIWNTFPSSSGALADVVLGQGDFGTGASNDDDQDGVEDATPTARTLHFPGGVTLLGDQLFVSDTENYRVLVYNGR